LVSVYPRELSLRLIERRTYRFVSTIRSKPATTSSIATFVFFSGYGGQTLPTELNQPQSRSGNVIEGSVHWNQRRFWRFCGCGYPEISMATMTMEEFAKKLAQIDFCMLNTNTGPGRINSRPMSNNGDVEYDGDSWFFSYEETRKVIEIEKEQGVSLTFSAPPSFLGKPGIFIAVEGQASLIRDKSQFEEHWVKDLDRWFPDGIETLGILLIKVSARTIEYWDGEDSGRIDVPTADAEASSAI
jgi:general stress protein 26